MITYKYITRIISVIMAAAVLVCLLAMASPQKVVQTMGEASVAMQYESELFDHSEVIQIDILMDEDAWNSMLSNALTEEYVSCDVVINGLKLTQVGIRPKGNTSLSSIAMDPDTDRFSLKLEFDHYVEGQTCYGLDKLILNNNYADSTNMKEAIIYDMYQYLNADASLYQYAKISVNGKYWGLYLALEAVEDSFLLRNYGTESGNLYKPENQDMGGAGPRNEDEAHPQEREKPNPSDEDGFSPPDKEHPRPQDYKGLDSTNKNERLSSPSDTNSMPSGENTFHPSGRMDFSRNQGPSMGNSGSDLNYTDDSLDSYSAIWEGEVTKTGEKDHRRVVTALKHIREGTDLEKYLDIDNILKYMAVHTFSVNMDSLSGVMAHNYYLYEYGGRLNILPWDYNLAFGGMGMGADDASQIINDAIDTPFQGTDFFNALLENEEYLARYHEYLRQLAEEYVLKGKFEETYNRIRQQIDALSESDPTAFYSCEEYETGAAMLYQTIFRRAESIQGQLNGSIPSTDDGQREDPSGLIDASAINIDAMGRFDRGEDMPPTRQF